MPKETILIVEDEEDILELVTYNLKREGYNTVGAGSGEDALAEAAARTPDLILLDLMLPGVDGLEVCRRLKKEPRTDGIPVIMLTAKGEEADIVAGLELGADDYVTKPFSVRVLVARVRAALRGKRRGAPESDDVIHAHDIEIDPSRYRVTVAGEPVPLTLTEFNVLRTLAARPGRVYTRYQIVDAVHGQDYPVTDRSVDVQIVGLRRKLGPAGSCVETVRGVGYRFRE